MSRKEEQKRIREQKKEAGKRREQLVNGTMKMAGVAVSLMLLYLLYLGIFSGAPVYAPDQVADNDHVKGNPDAALTLTMYADFQCPACLTEAQVISAAWPRISDRVKVVFRHFPLDTHRHAFMAARYAEAAGRQGRFWDMHDFLFVNQQSWSGLADPALTFENYALQLGLDMAQLKTDVDAEEIRAKIVADQQGGIRARVTGTPALFVNGRPVRNPRNAVELVEMVNRALER
jgi:protein-disulfide isomerase